MMSDSTFKDCIVKLQIFSSLHFEILLESSLNQVLLARKKFYQTIDLFYLFKYLYYKKISRLKINVKHYTPFFLKILFLIRYKNVVGYRLFAGILN